MNDDTRTPSIGDSVTDVRLVTTEDVAAFAELTGDSNPVHLDAEFAATTMFERPIAHGLYIASFISAILANRLPGPGTIYLGQDLKFRKPVYMDDTVTTCVRVVENPRPGRYVLETTCSNQDDDTVIEGHATVMYAPPS